MVYMQHTLIPTPVIPGATFAPILVNGVPFVDEVEPDLGFGEYGDAYGDIGPGGCMCRRCRKSDFGGCVRLPENVCWRATDDVLARGVPDFVSEERSLLALAGVPR